MYLFFVFQVVDHSLVLACGLQNTGLYFQRLACLQIYRAQAALLTT